MGGNSSASAACVCAFLMVRVWVSWVEMIKVEVGNIRSAVGNECGEITHSAGPAVSLMTSRSCGFHENQTSNHSCFHTKPSCFGDPNAFVSFFVLLQREIVWLFWHGWVMCEGITSSVRFIIFICYNEFHSYQCRPFSFEPNSLCYCIWSGPSPSLMPILV